MATKRQTTTTVVHWTTAARTTARTTAIALVRTHTCIHTYIRTLAMHVNPPAATFCTPKLLNVDLQCDINCTLLAKASRVRTGLVLVLITLFCSFANGRRSPTDKRYACCAHWPTRHSTSKRCLSWFGLSTPTHSDFPAALPAANSSRAELSSEASSSVGFS